MILTFDFSSDTPLYKQLRDQVVIGIAEGKIAPGEKLPTIRALAEESGINMMTVSKAYQLLKQEGYILTDRRSGAVVCQPKAEKPFSKDLLERLRLLISELRVAGMTEDEVADLCRKTYKEGQS